MTLYERMGGTYRQEEDYILPNVAIAAKNTDTHIGVWGEMHRRYLKEYHRVRYYNLLTSGKIDTYLADVDIQAEGMFHQLVKTLAEKENITEDLKKSNVLKWIQSMNNICERVREIVNKEIVYK